LLTRAASEKSVLRLDTTANSSHTFGASSLSFGGPSNHTLLTYSKVGSSSNQTPFVQASTKYSSSNHTFAKASYHTFASFSSATSNHTQATFASASNDSTISTTVHDANILSTWESVQEKSDDDDDDDSTIASFSSGTVKSITRMLRKA
jgi:hypothetical protein